jgi:hypothetical protein
MEPSLKEKTIPRHPPLALEKEASSSKKYIIIYI